MVAYWTVELKVESVCTGSTQDGGHGVGTGTIHNTVEDQESQHQAPASM